MDHDEVVFEVDDTGMGMSPEVHQRVFDAFYQADHESTRRHGGVGLGLTITRDLIDLMGGRLEIASTPDQGTRIRVHVPLALVQGQRQSGLISQSRPYDIQNMKVLVVEDDPVNSMLGCEVLMGGGPLPHPVGSGEEALG